MAELRLHIRPRVGKAMAQASEGIVPMAARALTRRASGSVAGTLVPGLGEGQAELPLTTGSTSALTERSEPSTHSAEPSRSGQERSSISPASRTTDRPMLRVVAGNGADAGSDDTARTSKAFGASGLEPMGRGVITGAIQAALDRRAGFHAEAVPYRTGYETDPPVTRPQGGQAASLSLAPADQTTTQASSLPRWNAGLGSVASSPAARNGSATGSAAPPGSPDASMGNPTLPQRVASPSAQTGIAHPAAAARTPSDPKPTGNPANPADAVRGAPHGPASASASNPRQPEDPREALAALLMPALPAAAPTLANTATPPETDFEFELRVRAALENILSEDLLRHGLFTPEVL